MSFYVATFYKFIELSSPEEIRETLQTLCDQNNLKGTILLAKEGINASIAGNKSDLKHVVLKTQDQPQFADIEPKYSVSEFMPFQKMKVRVKDEIVTMGIDSIEVSSKVGTHVKPHDWNALISDPEVTVIDTRNKYEFGIGTFSGSINPETESFRNFPDYTEENLDPDKNSKIAMFCTGGIRCEKASSYLLENGFSEVYQLEGGILNYLEQVPEAESAWEGECYVFDDRVTVKHNLEPGSFANCVVCGDPVSEEERNSDHYEIGKCCPSCHESLPAEKRRRLADRSRHYNSLASDSGLDAE